MASISLPLPGAKNFLGEEIGECLEKCEHKDCAETNRQSKALCIICKKPIGYENQFFAETGFKNPKHAICAYKS